MGPRGQRGVMMLEVLIGLLIFALGVIGLIGMQATALKVTADSKYRAEAAMHADRLVNQMWMDNRTNAALVANYVGSGSSGGPKYLDWFNDLSAAGTGLPGVSTCHHPDSVASPFSNQPVKVSIDASNTVTILICWQGPSETVAHSHLTVATITN